MKRVLLFLVWFAGFQVMKANAAITVTPATGGTNICANLALGGSTPGYSPLGVITVTEGVNTDFATGFRTLTINAPAGWQFNTGVAPTLAFTAGRNTVFINNAGFTTTQLTINLGVTGTTLIDAFTITGLQVRANSSASAAGSIRATSFTGFNGINGGTNFGNLSLTPSLVPSVIVSPNPTGAICAGTNVVFTAIPTNGGTPTYQWQLNGVPVAGATNATYSNATLANGNTVRVVMGATGCVAPTSATSAFYTAAVNAIPSAVTVTGGGSACNNITLNASITGAGTIYYQGVQFNGTSVATPSTSQFISTPGTNTYYFRARSAAGCWGPQGSATATIYLQPSALTITPSTTSTLCLGDSATFVVSATAPEVELLHQDFNSGLGGWTITNLAGVTNSYFQIRNSPGYNNAVAGDGTPYMQAAPDATGSSTIPTNTRFTSPSFSLTGYQSARVSFNQYYLQFPQDTTVGVDYSIDGGTTWVPVFNQARVFAGALSWLSTTPNFTIALPAATIGQSDVRLRWNYYSAWGWYWAVDNIKVNAVPDLTYSWVGVSGASGLSCSTCDTVTITPAVAGVNIYSVTTAAAGCTTVGGLTINVNPLPNIYDVTGGGSFCAGDAGVSVGLSSSDLGVDYQLYNGAVAIGTPVAGTGIALDFGLYNVAGTYSVVAGDASTTCAANMNGTAILIENPLPTQYNVTGGATFCVGDTGVHVGLSSSDTGISYQLFESATPIGTPLAGTGSPLDFGLFATPGAYNVVGTNNITLCTSGMADTAFLVANPLPTVYNVVGGGSYCVGGIGVSVALDNTEIGINYQLYNGATPVGAAVPGTGLPLDFGLQTAVGTYTVLASNGSTACLTPMNDSAVITINPLPDTITGTAVVCEGSTTTLSNATTGGTWSSSDATVATVGAATGVVTGVLAGVVDIIYTLPTGCGASASVTVNPLPVVAPIAGITNICAGTTTTLASATAGGAWTSANTAIATIDSVTGLVTGVAGGITTISYGVTNAFGCTAYATIADTVTALPVLGSIAGPAGVCIGNTVTYSNTTAGGAWTSSDATTAAIDAATGVTSGASVGSATITYTVSVYPGCASSVTRGINVYPLPVIDTISGAATVCRGLTINLNSTTTGGVWTSSNASIATVSATGVVTGIATGSAVITYTVTSTFGCTDFVTHNITVGNAMPSITVLPVGPSVTLCGGAPANLVASAATGLTYQWSVGGADIAGATDGSYTATTPGVYVLTIDNGTCSVALPSKTVLAQPVAVITYNTTGNYLYTGSFSGYQWFMNGTAIAGATSGIYASPAPGDYVVVITDVNGCTDTSDVYTVLPTGITTTTGNINITVYPNPASSVLHINAPVKVNVTVIAADGRVVIANQETENINVTELANGVYMLLIYDEHKTLLKTDRFSKMN
jgi:uncharacterized protein YjdB